MRLSYDLHIHSALSPCGDLDMTPNNIVNMSLIKGLDVIALTDHNSCRNLPGILDCAEGTGLLVIPGMEVETSEEVHMVCLFERLEDALAFETIVQEHMPAIPNDTTIFGEQIILDGHDREMGRIENLLVVATRLDIYAVTETVTRLGGIAVPAHVDKQAYSILSNLGFIPEDLVFPTLELSKNIDEQGACEKFPFLKGYRLLSDSDAHYLEDISEPVHFMEVSEKTPSSILQAFKRQKN